jgi:hypothetical protein
LSSTLTQVSSVEIPLAHSMVLEGGTACTSAGLRPRYVQHTALLALPHERRAAYHADMANPTH